MKLSTHFKLGLFTLVALVAALAAAFALGARTMREESVRYHFYFDESVQGLDVGAPVKFRGVPIGTVESILIAPDQRHVDVVAAIQVGAIARSGLVDRSSGTPRMMVSPGLRAQLGSQGITGVKLVNLDYFDESLYPPPPLPFEADKNSVPVATSFFKNLEDGLVGAVAALPDVAEGAVATLRSLELTVDDLQKERLPERASKVLGQASSAISELQRILKDVDQKKLPTRLAAALDTLTKTIAKLDPILGKLDGDEGLVSSTQRAVDRVGDVGEGALHTPEELDRTLRDVSEAAQAIRDLAELLEREPDMLVKGRSPGSSR